MNIADAVAQVEAELRAQGDAVRAENEKRYLKSDFVHLGVPMAPLRKVARSVVRVEPSRVDLLALAETLWSMAEGGRPIHEMRMASIEVLIRRVNLLGPGDLGLAETLIRDSASWVYVDHLAEKIVGGLVMAFPDQVGVLDRWVSDPYFWIRRTSLLALLPGVRTGEPDLERISRYGDALIEEKEFFIRKALGWVLRELTKKDHAEWVTAWVGERTDRISGVAIREAVRHLPEADARRLMAAYQSR